MFNFPSVRETGAACCALFYECAVSLDVGVGLYLDGYFFIGGLNIIVRVYLFHWLSCVSARACATPYVSYRCI